MFNAFYIIISLVSIVLALKYDYTSFDVLLLAITLVTSYASFHKMKSIRENVFILLVIVYIFCSVHIVALLELHSVGFKKNEIYENEYRQLAIWGTHLYFVLFAVFTLFSFFSKRRKSSVVTESEHHFPRKRAVNLDYAFKTFAVFVFFIQAISLMFGLNSDQVSAVVILPFHLNGLLDELRTHVFTFLFAIYIYHKYTNHEKFDRLCIVLFIIYSIIEVFVRSSKGALVESYLPALIMMVYVGQLNRKNFVRFVVPLLLALILIYPIVESARLEGALTVESFSNAAKGRRSYDDEEHSSTYIRTFLTGVYYTKLITEITPDELEFDFSHLPQLLFLGGGSAYMTRVIDNMPETAHHSSGITGLCDALLWGGYPMCYLVLTLLILIAVWGDHNRFLNKKILYKLILFFWFYDRFRGTTLSFLIDPLVLPAIGSIIINLLIAKYYYKKTC